MVRFLIVLTLLALVLQPAQSAAPACGDLSGGAPTLCAEVGDAPGTCPDAGPAASATADSCGLDFCTGGALTVSATTLPAAFTGGPEPLALAGEDLPQPLPVRLYRPPIA